MNAIYLDCFAGISGNMLLGAFLQAGVPESYLKTELSKLSLADEFQLIVTKVNKNGIEALYVEVDLLPSRAKTVTLHHSHDHNDHDDHSHHHEPVDGHLHRTMTDIRRLIEMSTLDLSVKKTSILIFETLAQAEGKVHGKPAHEVHFHEVGAIDSIVDIVGTAICLQYLQIEKIYVSKLNVGGGFVKCAHGLMPVPAPATAELLKNISFYGGTIEKELVTPTGAAVIKALANVDTTDLPDGFTHKMVAYGAGTWDLVIPNVLRMYIGHIEFVNKKSKKMLIETNIDDLSPQVYEYVFEGLFKAGARDVWITPIMMKKSRPAQILSVLVDDVHVQVCQDLIFKETSTIGLRIQEVERIEAKRTVTSVLTNYGEISCKISYYGDAVSNISVEYEDCKRLALQYDVPLKLIQQEALQMAHALYSKRKEGK
ncbi:hypothetical protein SAMN05660742_109135 [Propionispira arboris]|uniref:Pyridinium-3,5-bisthiocarboxylic acid mononucleotide nickel insertion protein n=1 Tax=Propionispira arboris TaxID=84035 RepID=A0A1H6ZT19_9FIRM|nr:nickel pincer cofactor biosynthesis protein LarC [Propionispira arboris]SEJ52832.1 hypothetical protein SAMN05660742_109135 [Propionispira arboris]